MTKRPLLTVLNYFLSVEAVPLLYSYFKVVAKAP